MNSLNSKTYEAITSDLMRHKVPLPLIFGLLCKLRGLTLNEFADLCGYTRNHIYKCLAGEVKPNQVLVAKATELFGFNVWRYSHDK